MSQDPAAQDPHVPQVGLSDQKLRETLSLLLDQIDSLPPEQRRRLKDVAEATRQRHDQLKDTVARLQETLDTLRLSIKYLIFDVEATRRENEFLRRQLEEGGGSHS